MKILKVKGTNDDFKMLCSKLENFQFEMLPVLREKEYSLTDDLENITGFVLYVDDKPVGSIGLKHISDEACEIVRVFVMQNYRGNGYAKLLFSEVESLAKKMGYKRAEMVAWKKATAALKLYKDLNYVFGEEQVSSWYGGNLYIELYKNL